MNQLSKYSFAVCQQKVLLPMCNIFARRKYRHKASVEIVNLSAKALAATHLHQQSRPFSEHFTPYDSKKKCPTKEIFQLIQHGSVEDLREWIETGGIDVNCRDDNMKTPLIVAAELNRAGMMRVLMKHDADVNLQDIFGDTALMAASRENSKKAVELLLANKDTQLDLKDNEEMVAADFTQDVEIDECIRAKSDVNFQKYKEEVLRPYTIQPKVNTRPVTPSDKEVG